MENFRLLAHPWWINLLLLVPLVAYLLFRRNRPQLTSRELLTSAVFALSFGLVESAVAIYIGAAIGFLPVYAPSLSDLSRLPADLDQQARQVGNLPPGLVTVEVFREAATILMLLSVAVLVKQKRGERFAFFLWIFALWDIGYYVALWAMVRWPYSPTSPDVLFLIPVAWISQVWFPILISIMTVAVVLFTGHRGRRSSAQER